MASIAVKEAKEYLWRLGCNPDETADPNELIRQLVRECETLTKTNKSLSEKLVDRVIGIDDEPQLQFGAQVA